MKLTFLGATDSVAGSCFLLEVGGKRFLIDCGLFQGAHFVEQKNYDDFSFDPKAIDALFVTHAHLDHIGRIPKLMRAGFRGTIFGTAPTRELTLLSLRDSVSIMCREAERVKKAQLCYPVDLDGIRNQWRDVRYRETIEIDNTRVTFYDAAHILGSAFILVECEAGRIVFSGDLGNISDPLLPEIDLLPEADYLVLESTYGDRDHEDPLLRRETLEDVIERTARQKGTLLIPAFAVERTQELIVEMNRLMLERKTPTIPIFLDSTLAIQASEVYLRFPEYLKAELRNQPLFQFKNLSFTRSREESAQLKDYPDPKIIIAGSGMSQGGRIVRHEKVFLPKERTILLIVGFQAEGSLGRRLAEGAKEVLIEGEKVPVRATVKALYGYSAHRDRTNMLEWVNPQRSRLKRVFLVHGESKVKEKFKSAIQDILGIRTDIPAANEVFTE